MASAKTVDRYPDLNQGCWGLAIGVGRSLFPIGVCGLTIEAAGPSATTSCIVSATELPSTLLPAGYSMVLRAAMMVRLASWLGLVSTMQCIPGAVVGVALVNMDL